ncbi:MAG TPA: SRPBCC family protein [Acidimicrobiales bacterium]|jgi:hypothetical protein|nr:SRPBCC family protein [Acidimicrobiales bacterium]
MWEVTERIVVGAPQATVWAVVTDVPGHAELAGSGEIQALRLTGPVGPGATWEADIAVPGLEPFVSRSEVVVFDEPTEFSWTSVPRSIVPGEPRSTPGVRWWFALAPADDGGTAVEHRVLVTTPEIGAEEMVEFFEETNRVDGIRAGMQVTLQRLKAAVERSR